MEITTITAIIGGSITVGAVVGLALKGVFVTKAECEKRVAGCQGSAKENAEKIEKKFNSVEERLSRMEDFLTAIMFKLGIKQDDMPPKVRG